MTLYVIDSLGAPIEIIREPEIEKVGEDFKGQDVYEDEEICTYKAQRTKDGKVTFGDEYFFKDDIYQYIKTLEREDLIEILERVNEKEILEAGEIEEGYV